MSDQKPLRRPERMPAALTKLYATAKDRGWDYRIDLREDSGGDPFLDVVLRRPDGAEARVCWHTRDTGTNSLFSCILRSPARPAWRHLTLTALRMEMTSLEGAAGTGTWAGEGPS